MNIAAEEARLFSAVIVLHSYRNWVYFTQQTAIEIRKNVWFSLDFW